jgi:hypothetical protein
MHCNGNSVYMFLFWEWRGLGPGFRIHVSLGGLYVPGIGLHISSSGTGGPVVGMYGSLVDAWVGGLGLGPDGPFLGIFVSNFRRFVFAVCEVRLPSTVRYMRKLRKCLNL